MAPGLRIATAHERRLLEQRIAQVREMMRARRERFDARDDVRPSRGRAPEEHSHVPSHPR